MQRAFLTSFAAAFLLAALCLCAFVGSAYARGYADEFEYYFADADGNKLESGDTISSDMLNRGIRVYIHDPLYNYYAEPVRRSLGWQIEVNGESADYQRLLIELSDYWTVNVIALDEEAREGSSISIAVPYYVVDIYEFVEAPVEVPVLDERGNPVVDESGNVVTEIVTEKREVLKETAIDTDFGIVLGIGSSDSEDKTQGGETARPTTPDKGTPDDSGSGAGDDADEGSSVANGTGNANAGGSAPGADGSAGVGSSAAAGGSEAEGESHRNDVSNSDAEQGENAVDHETTALSDAPGETPGNASGNASGDVSNDAANGSGGFISEAETPASVGAATAGERGDVRPYARVDRAASKSAARSELRSSSESSFEDAESSADAAASAGLASAKRAYRVLRAAAESVGASGQSSPSQSMRVSDVGIELSTPSFSAVVALLLAVALGGAASRGGAYRVKRTRHSRLSGVAELAARKGAPADKRHQAQLCSPR